jgi:DNA-binding GntR family transcriptional regulator
MSEPQYSHLAEQLRKGILAGRYAPGTRLPTERKLCMRFRVSRITVRQALSLLEDELLISRRQGSGTYVRRNPARRIPLMIDYTGSVRDHAPTLSRKVLLSRTGTAPEWVAEELRVARGAKILYAERVDTLGSTAVAWDEVYIRRDYAGALTRESLARLDFVEAWCEAQEFRPAACRQRVDAVSAARVDEKRLGLPTGAPLLKAIDIYDAIRDRPAGLFVSHYHPEYISITSRFDYGRAEEHA